MASAASTTQPVRVEPIRGPEALNAIAALYPGKSPSEQAEMVRRSLEPECRAHCDGKRAILVARLGHLTVGTVQVVWSDPDENPVLKFPGAAVIHHLRTHPDYQGQGIGRLLLSTAEELASARGLCRLTLGVEPENTHARRLYRKWGYREFCRYKGEQDETLVGMYRETSIPSV